MTDRISQEITEAAESIIDAFRANDGERYFAGFASDCSFAFHTDQSILEGSAAWRAEWEGLVEGGWRVVDCRSLRTIIQPIGDDAGVFLHELETTSEQHGERLTYRERETIVFERRNGRLVAVHEHLSPLAETVSEKEGE